MTRAAAFLRAINVGGHTVRMEDLRRIFTDLGLMRVETFIASGNVVFDTTARNMRRLEDTIARRLGEELDYEVATFVRTTEELAGIAVHTAFDAAEIERCPTFCVAFLGGDLGRKATTNLMALSSDSDRFHIHGPHVYWLSRMKQNESKFSNVLFERAIGQSATLRGMNTIRRMAARYCGASAGVS